LLIERLKEIRDPETGEQVISNVFRAKEIYSGPYVADAPDLIIAYNNYYRASWDTVLGAFPKELISDNTDAWSGDHCVDSQFVPGVLLCNCQISTDRPELQDLAPSILTEFGVPIPEGMTGKMIL
jgi:predicted AlkP superfamily phosphohydrolase/phosphomutase